MPTLIADCGTTKCAWALITEAPDRSPLIFHTRGFNAATADEDSIGLILCTELLPQLPEGMSATIDRIYFYGAGCIGGDADRRVADLLDICFPNARIEVATDLLGAARALLGHNAGVACILGTGSNSGLYDGEKIVLNTPPLGFILGDEGSGAALGKRLINAVFKRSASLPSSLREAFFEEYPVTMPKVIDRVYRQPAPARYLASFAPFLSKHISHPAIASMVKQEMTFFVRRNLLSYFAAAADTTAPSAELLPSDAPIGFVGSIAAHFEKQLCVALRANGLIGPITIIDAPIERLAAFHNA